MSGKIVPPSLRIGDTVAIVPTARAITLHELKDGIALMQSWGLRVKLGAGVGRKHFQHAGTARERATDLQSAIDDPAVHAIWCARGGYGTAQLLDHIDLSGLQQHPKWIAGFSDITVLHNALHRLGVASLHAQMPYNIAAKGPETVSTLRSALKGEAYTIASPTRALADRMGECVGELIGGNLSLLYALRGTPYDVDPRGKILFLEDLDELLYHMDRMVMNLHLAGWFNDLAGLIVGGMADMHDLKEQDPFGESAEQIIARTVAPFEYPVCYHFPSGHIPDNRALVLGQKAKLSVTANGATLSFGNGLV